MNDTISALYHRHAQVMALDERAPVDGADEEMHRLEHLILATPVCLPLSVSSRDLSMQAAIALKLIEGIGDDLRVPQQEREAIELVCKLLKSLTGPGPLH